ncbi:MAG: c-type cytochrome [Chitinophagaceae bacterium]|nr:c-type cytochrome [Chitinophagaceae bacterium]
MIPCKSIGKRLSFLFLSLFAISIINSSAQGDAAAGKALFLGKCAACHNVFKDMTGPALGGLEERGKWADHNELLKKKCRQIRSWRSTCYRKVIQSCLASFPYPGYYSLILMQVNSNLKKND